MLETVIWVKKEAGMHSTVSTATKHLDCFQAALQSVATWFKLSRQRIPAAGGKGVRGFQQVQKLQVSALGKTFGFDLSHLMTFPFSLTFGVAFGVPTLLQDPMASMFAGLLPPPRQRCQGRGDQNYHA